MSREPPVGLKVVEKFFGLLLTAMGIWVLWELWHTEGIGEVGFTFSVFFGLALMVLGVLMVLAKAE